MHPSRASVLQVGALMLVHADHGALDPSSYLRPVLGSKGGTVATRCHMSGRVPRSAFWEGGGWGKPGSEHGSLRWRANHSSAIAANHTTFFFPLNIFIVYMKPHDLLFLFLLCLWTVRIRFTAWILLRHKQYGLTNQIASTLLF